MSPERGRVLVDGIDVAGDPERRAPQPGRAAGRARRVQAPDRAREHHLLRRLHGLSAATIAERTSKLSAALLQMDDFLDRATGGFSQGQRTKTAIARALVHDPRT